MNTGSRLNFREQFDAREGIKSKIEFEVQIRIQSTHFGFFPPDQGSNDLADTGGEANIILSSCTVLDGFLSRLLFFLYLKSLELTGDCSWKRFVANGQ